MSREDTVRALARDWGQPGKLISGDRAALELTDLLDTIAQLRLELASAQRARVDQARRLSLLGEQRGILIEEVAYLQCAGRVPWPPERQAEHESDDLDVIQSLRELHELTGPLVVTRYGQDGRP